MSDALTSEADKEIEKAVAEKRPFYLNMAHYAVHSPFETDKRFIGHYTDPKKNQQACAFATLIEGMDKSLGDLMDKLEELGIAENTLIIFWGIMEVMPLWGELRIMARQHLLKVKRFGI